MIFNFTIFQNFLSCECLEFCTIEAVCFVSVDFAAVHLTLLIIPPFTTFNFFLTYIPLQMIRPMFCHLHCKTTRLRIGARVEGCNLILSSINSYLFLVYLPKQFKLPTADCEYSCRGTGTAML